MANTTSRRHYVNNAPTTTLAGTINNAVTSLSVASASGFPTVPFIAVLEANTSNEEIVLVTNVVGTTWTIARAQDGTSAVSHLAGTNVNHGLVRQDADECNAHSAATSGVHGVAGSVVGSSDAQTLTNKTLDSPTTTGSPTGPGWVPLGGIIPFGGYTAPAGWLLCDGSTVSRTTYAALFNVLSFTQTCTTTNGSTSVTVADTSQMFPTMTVEGSGIPAGVGISTVVDATHITLTFAATSSGSKTLRFFPFGCGDASTTFGLPDYRSRAPMGPGPNYPGTGPYNGHGTGGDGFHSHTLSDSGQAALTHPGGTNTLSGRFVASSWTATDSVTGSSNAADGTSRTLGVALRGNTDSNAGAVPNLRTNFIIRSS